MAHSRDVVVVVTSQGGPGRGAGESVRGPERKESRRWASEGEDVVVVRRGERMGQGQGEGDSDSEGMARGRRQRQRQRVAVGGLVNFFLRNLTYSNIPIELILCRGFVV